MYCVYCVCIYIGGKWEVGRTIKQNKRSNNCLRKEKKEWSPQPQWGKKGGGGSVKCCQTKGPLVKGPPLTPQGPLVRPRRPPVKRAPITSFRPRGYPVRPQVPLVMPKGPPIRLRGPNKRGSFEVAA